LGDDVYVLDSASDVITELAGQGNDTMVVGFTSSLRSNVENITLSGTGNINATGNSGVNTLIGNVGNNVLNGGLGADLMIGGLGNDSYEVSEAGDVVIENLNEGLDNVSASVSYTLGANVENLSLTGTAAIDGTGNELGNTLNGNSNNNVLIGLDGNDVLNGGVGADTMVGGIGNDSYFVDNAGDTVSELSGQGTDNVYSGINYTLGVNLENLTLTGTSAINGTGNTQANSLSGNTGNNILSGDAGNDVIYANAGNDTLIGGLGADTLVGAAGNDTYLMQRGDGADSITDTDSTVGNTDLLWFNDASIASNQLWFRKVGNDLEVAVIGTSDKATIKNWYSGAGNQVEQIKAGDGKVLEASEVAALVSAMAAFTTRPAGATTLTTTEHTALDAVIAANWS
jgi:Ca2+-binding RTX toxin-like protein